MRSHSSLFGAIKSPFFAIVAAAFINRSHFTSFFPFLDTQWNSKQIAGMNDFESTYYTAYFRMITD